MGSLKKKRGKVARRLCSERFHEKSPMLVTDRVLVVTWPQSRRTL